MVNLFTFHAIRPSGTNTNSNAVFWQQLFKIFSLALPPQPGRDAFAGPKLFHPLAAPRDGRLDAVHHDLRGEGAPV